MEPKEANYVQNEKIVIRCSATLKPLHQKRSNSHDRIKLVNDLNEQEKMHRHHRMSKPATIYWYKENDILKEVDSSLIKNKLRHDSSHQLNVNNLPQRHHHQHKLNILTEHDLDDNLLKSVLTIENAKASDSGKYKCVYENIQEQVTVHVRRNLGKIRTPF